MATTVEARSAPPIVRRVGYYLLGLAVLSLLPLVMSIVGDDARWYQLVATPLSFAIALGLIWEKRWAYVAALVVAASWTLFYLGVLVFNVIWPSGLGLTVGLVLMVSLALVAPPLLLLGEPGRAWFWRRELQPAA